MYLMCDEHINISVLVSLVMSCIYLIVSMVVNDFLKNCIYSNWRIVTLQYCDGFCHTLTWLSHRRIYDPHPKPLSHLPPHPVPLGHPSALALSALFRASNLDWSSISHYMFQCYSLKPSHPHLLPQSPKVCSLHLCLFCCLTYSIIITIFLNSIYMR